MKLLNFLFAHRHLPYGILRMPYRNGLTKTSITAWVVVSSRPRSRTGADDLAPPGLEEAQEAVLGRPRDAHRRHRVFGTQGACDDAVLKEPFAPLRAAISIGAVGDAPKYGEICHGTVLLPPL